MCDEDLTHCALSYVRITLAILNWKEETPEPEPEPDPETVKSAKTPKEATPKTVKTEKTAKEKTAKEKTAKEKTAKEKTAKEKTAKEKTVKKRSVQASKEKTVKNSKEKTVKNSKEKTVKNSKEKSTKSTKTPVPLDRTKELESFCLIFEQMWTCVTEKWDVLPDTTLQLVKMTYTSYHSIVTSICLGKNFSYLHN